MKIKIVEKNAAKIEAALELINGKATAHTYTTFAEVLSQAVLAEHKREKIFLLKKDAAGLQAQAISGDTMPVCYTYGRKATRLKIERNATGAWFVIEIVATSIFPSGGYDAQLHLTPQQNICAMKGLQNQYVVKKK